MLETLLKNENWREVKGQEIAKLISVPKTIIKDIEIEIISFQAIKNGIEVYARAWQNSKQIGFGQDGSVDIERFIFINPPVLVNDVNGNIVREWIDKQTGQLKQRKLREDPKKAILQALEHTISVKKDKFDDKNIIKNKIGRTTLTVYPDAGNPGTTTVDADVQHNIGTGDSWANVRNGAGNTLDNSAEKEICALQSHTNANNWIGFWRSIFHFDTSSIGASMTISSATLSFWGTAKADNYSQSIHIVQGLVTSNTTIAASDYALAKFGSTSFASMTIASFNAGGAYNDFSLNSNGLSNINKTGISKFAGMASGDLNNVEPTWASATNGFAVIYFADQTGTSNDPKLVVEYSEAAAWTPKIIMF